MSQEEEYEEDFAAKYDGVFAGEADGDDDESEGDEEDYGDEFEGAEPAMPDPRAEDGSMGSGRPGAADDGSMGSGRPGAAVGRDRGGEAPTDAYGRPMSRQSPPGTRDGGFDPEASRLNRQLRRQLEAFQDDNEQLREQLDALQRKEADRRAARVARHEFSTTQLQDEIYDLSTKIVGEGEKNRLLAETLTKVTAERDTLVADAESTKKYLVGRISRGEKTADAYKNVTTLQLVELRERSMELEGRQSKTIISKRSVASEEPSEAPPASSEPTPEGNEAVAAAIKRLEGEIAKLRGKLRHSEDEKTSLRAELRGALAAGDDVRALKHKATELLARGKAEKDQRQKAEAEAKLTGKKVAALSDHVEKLMVHLKHEVGAKAQVTDQLRRAEKDLDTAKLRSRTLARRNNAREKFVLELKEGSKILEDQLKLMDRRYLELRAKLDWTRQHAETQVKRAKKAASTLRAKWALATNSSQGLLDEVQLPAPGTLTQQSHFPPETIDTGTKKSVHF